MCGHKLLVWLLNCCVFSEVTPEKAGSDIVHLPIIFLPVAVSVKPSAQ